MNNLNLNNLLFLVNTYDSSSVEVVKEAYDFANKYHEGQKRQSGEDYIIHPLNVAFNLAKMNADCATICAGLLHDVLEDTEVTEEELTEKFGAEVCKLVLGVTKISNIHFVKDDDSIMENTRKIITSLKNDVRIIIIKLSDRLHNMQTLEFKKPEKRVKHAKETLEIFVPIAYHIGAYNLMEELEDLSLKYIDETAYNFINDKKQSFKDIKNDLVKNMISDIKDNLNIKNDIILRELNLSGINKRINKGFKFEEIHNILSLVICTESIDDCYKTLGVVHSLYRPVNHKFKDYISNPKTNKYQSLHTTVFCGIDTLIQIQIRTFEMDLIACLGLTKYWYTAKENASLIMNQDLNKNYQFYESLLDLDEFFCDNYEFMQLVKGELLNDKVYCYSTKGDIFELPKGSTVIDFAYKIHTDIGNKMISALVNESLVEIDYVLKNKDRVRIITDDSVIDRSDWVSKAHTSYAKRKINEILKGDTKI